VDHDFEDPGFALLWADALFIAEYDAPDGKAADRHADELHGPEPRLVFLLDPAPAKRAA
jgi:hypothetical protein